MENKVTSLLVRKEALLHNLNIFRSVASDSEVGCVVKANAYGCSAELCSRLLFSEGVRRFFVATVEEAFGILSVFDTKELTQIRIYVIADVCELSFQIHPSIVPVVSSVEMLSWLLEKLEQREAGLETPTDICLHFETGMNRFALPSDLMGRVLNELDTLHQNDWAGEVILMSHLACADDVESEMNERQLNVFKHVTRAYPWMKTSLSGSAGVALGRQYQANIVRAGIGLYGGRPSLNAEELELERVVEIRAPIIQIKSVNPNETIGYGADFKVKAPLVVATVRLGYADGIDRRLNQLGFVGVIDNQLCRVVGRISMDLITIDVSEVSEEALVIGNEVAFFSDKQDVNEVADLLDTIPNEVMVKFGNRLDRKLV